jgi:hypothetical protein
VPPNDFEAGRQVGQPPSKSRCFSPRALFEQEPAFAETWASFQLQLDRSYQA